MTIIKPFQDEAASIMIDDLTIENGRDRIALYGSLQITRDTTGLKLAKALKEFIDATVAALQAEKLPDHIAIQPPEVVDNPFKS